MNWLLENKDWMFSGAGVSILGIIVTYFQVKKRRKRKPSVTQNQQSGANSMNIQIGGDLKK